MITPFPSGRKRRPLSVWNSSPSARLMGCPAPVGNSTVGEGCFTPLDATHFPSGDMSRAIPEPNRIAGEPSVLRRKTVYSAPPPSPSSSSTARCPSLETLRPSVQSNQERSTGVQVEGDVARRLETLRWILFKTVPHDTVQPGREVGDDFLQFR